MNKSMLTQCSCHNYIAAVPLTSTTPIQPLGTLQELQSKDKQCQWWAKIIESNTKIE